MSEETTKQEETEAETPATEEQPSRGVREDFQTEADAATESAPSGASPSAGDVTPEEAETTSVPAAEAADVDFEDGSALARAESKEAGWPCETTDGERVLIVAKESTPSGDILIDTEGTKYAASANTAAGTVIQKLDADGRLPREEEAAA